MITAKTRLGREIQRVRDLYYKQAQPDGRERLRIQRGSVDAIHAALKRQRFAIIAALLAGEELKNHNLDREFHKVFMEHKQFDILKRVQSMIRDAVVPVQAASAGLGYARGVENLRSTGVTASVVSRNVVVEGYLLTNGADLIQGINEHTAQRVRDIVQQGLASEQTPQQIANTLFNQGNQGVFSRARAELISTQEIANAYGVSNFDTVTAGALNTGVKIEKQWVTVGDDRVDDDCLIAEAQGWIPREDTFANGQMHEPEHVGCRCYVDYRGQ